ncbi:MAG: PAS domain S-box protein [Ignavibacteria bacterium]|nr:PAS domain S-box protein [Ignavibacteria bacterium]
MENMVTSEFEKQKEFLKNELRSKYNIPEADIDSIADTAETVLFQMIQLMKEGKSAHEKFFSDIILNSIDAIVGFDNEYNIFLWNRGAENIFGYKKFEVMGKDFSFLIPQYLLEKGEKEFLIDEVKSKGFLANHETERITKSGELINVSISRFAVNNEKNEPIGSVGIIRDITLVKKLEKELREKENLALIGEVVSSIAHSLSNPLNIISGNADFLLLNKKSTSDEYEELKTILDETTRITKSIRHLLNFSRPVKINRTENDLNELINKISKQIKFLKDNKDIKLRKSLQKDLPKVKFDYAQIEESIMNILTNAVQAIHKTGEIGIRTSSNGSIVKVDISDDGQGISKENQAKIFLPFFSSKEYGKGTGLGLSIAKKALKEHNGDIKVKSNPGKGTTFTLTLPAD